MFRGIFVYEQISRQKWHTGVMHAVYVQGLSQVAAVQLEQCSSRFSYYLRNIFLRYRKLSSWDNECK